MTLPNLLRRYGDLALGICLATLYLAELMGRDGSTEHLVEVATSGVGAALSLTFRRRTPLASFVMCMALLGLVAYLAPDFSNDSYAVMAVFLFNLYSLGAHAGGIEAWLGLGGLVAGIVVLARLDGDHTAGGMAFDAALCGLPWGTGTALRLRLDRVAELEARNATLHEEAQRAVAEERSRIARELHDVVSHAIAVTVLQARGGRRMIGREDAAVLRALGAIEQTNTAALADMRRLLALLRDSGAETSGSRDEPAPSLERLDHLLHRVSESGLPVELQITGEAVPLPPGLDLSAYRIVQEALTNVLKHAGPQAHAHVAIAYGAEELVVEVTNIGRVPSASGSGGHGLIGIRERAAVAGGSVEAGAEAGGYAVRARLPYLTELVARAETLQVP